VAAGTIGRMAQDLQQLGEELVAAARSGDGERARRITDHFVLNHHVDEGIPYWERAAEADAFAAFTLARYRKTRGDRAEAERLYRSHAEEHAGCAYGLGVLLREDRTPEAEEWFQLGWEDFGHLDCKIELGKGMAAQGHIDEAAAFLMKDVGIGDIAVFRWVQLFEGIRKEFDEADTALREAEESGDAQAVYEALRPLFGVGKHLPKYPGLLRELASYYHRAGELDAQALVRFTFVLDEAAWDTDPMPEIRELLLRAHESGNADAPRVLGVMHQRRAEVGEAERWYLVGAEAGDRYARWNLGMLCKRQRRLDEAERWFRTIAEVDEDVPDELDDIERIRSAGAQKGKDLRRLPGLRERAEAGDVRAGFAFGMIAYDWEGAQDRHMIRWYEPAARAGDPEAAYRLAQLHSALREPEARDHWWRRAAEGGHLDGCFQLGWLAEQHKDFQEAERWYARAAEEGWGLAAMLTGKLRAQRGAWAEAEPLLRRVWEEEAEADHAVEAAGYYGLVLNELGRHAEAVEPLSFAAERWDEVLDRYDRDDLAIRVRMTDPDEELERAHEASAAG